MDIPKSMIQNPHSKVNIDSSQVSVTKFDGDFFPSFGAKPAEENADSPTWLVFIGHNRLS
jgi:hypothetical protein